MDQETNSGDRRSSGKEALFLTRRTKSSRTVRSQADEVLDTAGNRSLSHLRRALTPRGTLVIVGGEGGGRWFGGFDRQIIRAPVLSMFVRQKVRALVSKERQEDLRAVAELIETGKVAHVIDRTYPLRDAPDAIRYLAEGHARGKVVVTV